MAKRNPVKPSRDDFELMLEQARETQHQTRAALQNLLADRPGALSKLAAGDSETLADLDAAIGAHERLLIATKERIDHAEAVIRQFHLIEGAAQLEDRADSAIDRAAQAKALAAEIDELMALLIGKIGALFDKEERFISPARLNRAWTHHTIKAGFRSRPSWQCLALESMASHLSAAYGKQTLAQQIPSGEADALRDRQQAEAVRAEAVKALAQLGVALC